MKYKVKLAPWTVFDAITCEPVKPLAVKHDREWHEGLLTLHRNHREMLRERLRKCTDKDKRIRLSRQLVSTLEKIWALEDKLK